MMNCKCETRKSIFENVIDDMLEKYDVINELIYEAIERNLDHNFDVINDIYEDTNEHCYVVTVRGYVVEIYKSEIVEYIEHNLFDFDTFEELQDYVIDTMQDLVLDELEETLRTEID